MIDKPMEVDIVYILKDYRLWHMENGKMIILMYKNYFHFFIVEFTLYTS